MKRHLIGLSIGIGAMLLATQHSFGQSPRNCGERSNVVARLADKYGESRQMIGLGANNSVVEIFASQESGTWTITVTLPNGLTCLVASGQAYEETNEVLQPASGEAL